MNRTAEASARSNGPRRSTGFEAEQVTTLSTREALSLVNLNLAAPINLALAANVLSDGSAALANAVQTAPIGQGI
jgi:hypothetical protein